MKITIRPLQWVVWPIYAWRSNPYEINFGPIKVTW